MTRMEQELALEERMIAAAAKKPRAAATLAAEMAIEHPSVQKVVHMLDVDDPVRIAIEQFVQDAAFIAAMAMKKYWRQAGAEEGSGLILREYTPPTCLGEWGQDLPVLPEPATRWGRFKRWVGIG